MTEARDRTDGRSHERLQAYHDGELSGLARRRFERELRRSPGLRGELEELRALRERLRQWEAGAPSPDLWDAIALRLPALDARRIEAPVEAPRRASLASWSPWWKPIGAVAATAALVAAFLYGGFWRQAPAAGGVVRWIDSGDRSVMVLDDDPDTTIIWILDGGTEGARIGGGSDTA